MNAARFNAIVGYHEADEERFVEMGLQMRPAQHKHRKELIDLIDKLDVFGTVQGQRQKPCRASGLDGAA